MTGGTGCAQLAIRSASVSETFDGAALRQALRHLAAGVTVITSVNEAGDPVGMTATAFSSVSLDPPMVLVCVNATARTRHAIEGRAGYAVNILGLDQEPIARRFASSATEKFEGVSWRPGTTGVPLIEGALTTLECEVVRSVEAGTHIVYIGAVRAGSDPGGDPLLYFDGSYRTLGPPASD